MSEQIVIQFLMARHNMRAFKKFTQCFFCALFCEPFSAQCLLYNHHPFTHLCMMWENTFYVCLRKQGYTLNLLTTLHGSFLTFSNFLLRIWFFLHFLGTHPRAGGCPVPSPSDVPAPPVDTRLNPCAQHLQMKGWPWQSSVLLARSL